MATDTAQPAVSLEAVQALILDLTGKVDAQNEQLAAQNAEMDRLRAQVRDQSSRIPAFQPLGARADADAIFAGLQRGKPFDREGDHARMVIGTDGHPLSGGELQRDPPAYQVGEVVALNLDATPRGHERTWGELVEEINEKQKRRKRKQVSTVGRVRYIQYKRADGQYKYRCVFPGLSSLNPEKDRGMGFDQDELLPLGGAA